MALIGINGGTFDPIHYGHLRAALEVQQQLGLDQVLFVPCYQPVHRDQPQVSAQQRCEMIQAAIESQPCFKLETLEIDRGGPSYMVETLALLKCRMPDDSLVLMMGSDAFSQFYSWHDWQGILAQANIAVMHRPGDSFPVLGPSASIYQTHQTEQLTQSHGQIIEVKVTQLDISSTLVRRCYQQGDSADYLLPPSVMAIIEKNGLYRAVNK